MLVAAVALAVSSTHQSGLRINYFLTKMFDDTLDASRRMAYIDTLERLGYWRSRENRGQLGHAYIMSGRFDKAESVYDSLSRDRQLPVNRHLNAVYWTAFCNMILGDYEKSLDNIYSLLTAEKPDSLKYYDVEADFMVSGIYDKIGNLPASLKYLDKAAAQLPRLHCDPNVMKNLTYRLHMERASYFVGVHDYEKALDENRKARNAGMDRYSSALQLMDLSQIYEATGDFDIAEEYFRRFFAEASGNYVARLNLGYASSNYALFLFNRGRYNESITVARKYLSSSESASNRHVNGTVYEILARSLAATGRSDEAYNALWRSREILDSVRGKVDKVASTGAILRFEERVTLGMLDKLKAQERRRTLVIIALVIAIGMCAAGILWLWRRYKGQRRGNERMVSEMSVREDAHLREIRKSRDELSDSSREIVALSMQMAEKDAIISEIKSLARKSQGKPENMLANIRSRLLSIQPSQRTWEVFRLYFEKSHPEFFKRIHSLHPDLTQGESKMCAFINMNLTSKEIAGITCRSERAVESMKYRLHKKLGLSPSMSTRAYLLTITRDARE